MLLTKRTMSRWQSARENRRVDVICDTHTHTVPHLSQDNLYFVTQLHSSFLSLFVCVNPSSRIYFLIFIYLFSFLFFEFFFFFFFFFFNISSDIPGKILRTKIYIIVINLYTYACMCVGIIISKFIIFKK